MKIAVEVGDIYLNEFVIMFLVVTRDTVTVRHYETPPPATSTASAVLADSSWEV